MPGDILGDQSVPPGGVPFLGGGAERLPLLLPALGDLKLLGLRVGHEGQTLKFQAQLDFATPDAASAAGDFLNGLVRVAAGLAPGGQASGALDRLQVEANGARVTIRLEAAVSDLGRLLGGVPTNPGGDLGGP